MERTLIQPAANAVEAYLKHLQKEFARGDATEHTHRPALKTLIESAAIGIAATNEPKAIDARAKALFEKFAIFRNPTRLNTYFELPLNACRDSPHYP